MTLGIVAEPLDPLSVATNDAVEAAAAELGVGTVRVGQASDLDGLDWGLIVGPPANYPVFLASLRAARPRPRARLIAWLAEPLPRSPAPASGSEAVTPPSGPGAMASVVDALGRRGVLQRLQRPLQPLRHVPVPGRLATFRATAVAERERAANLADAVAIAALTDEFVTTSADRYRVLKANGVNATIVPFGYHRLMAGPLVRPGESDRDIPVLVLGSHVRGSHAPRGLTLERISRSWPASAPITVVEGAWGAERDALIRRARIVLNIQRGPGEFAGIRFLIGMAGGALIVSEPVDEAAPFVPWVHHVEAPADQLGEVVAGLIADDERRIGIAAAGQALIRDHVTMAASLARILDLAPPRTGSDSPPSGSMR